MLEEHGTTSRLSYTYYLMIDTLVANAPVVKPVTSLQPIFGYGSGDGNTRPYQQIVYTTDAIENVIRAEFDTYLSENSCTRDGELYRCGDYLIEIFVSAERVAPRLKVMMVATY
jgi:hypothetical protein